MAVITTADKHLAAVITHLTSAIDEVSQVVIQRCEGWDDMKHDYKNVLKECLSSLIQIREEVEDTERYLR